MIGSHAELEMTGEEVAVSQPEFEYAIRRLDWDSARFEADEITKLLNAYEARGWQYVETVTPHTGGPVTVFRRRLR